MQRSSGILMHISSLPSPYGIGTLGSDAFSFADFLAEAGQTYWQMLPLGQTGFGNSPYQCLSAFAGNPYFIDLDRLAQDGLLQPQEYQTLPWGQNPNQVDYGMLWQHRYKVLRLAFERGTAQPDPDFHLFREENQSWLRDYAMFCSIKARHDNQAWVHWPNALRLRDPGALSQWETEHEQDLAFYAYVQYLFFRQWDAFKAYCHRRGLKIIGDIPIYVPLDSADVWANPEQFQLNQDHLPRVVAGVPPDYFSATGQLWGNPIYDWAAMGRDGFAWWAGRIQAAARLFDVVRIDHFRGLASYWSVPYGAQTAENGRWEPGPGRAFIDMLRDRFPGLSLIAEDLGLLTPDVHDLMDYSGYPGMRVLEFAFDACSSDSSYLPHRYVPGCVCYTGTHDNDTILGWASAHQGPVLEFASKYLGLNQEEGIVKGMLRGGMGSVANLFIAQMQDYLGLDAQARMNTPSTLDGNWQWRALPGQLDGALAQEIREITARYGRCFE